MKQSSMAELTQAAQSLQRGIITCLNLFKQSPLEAGDRPELPIPLSKLWISYAMTAMNSEDLTMDELLDPYFLALHAKSLGVDVLTYSSDEKQEEGYSRRLTKEMEHKFTRAPFGTRIIFGDRDRVFRLCGMVTTYHTKVFFLPVDQVIFDMDFKICP